MKVVTVDEMREIERRAEREYGLTSPLLMERAGRSVAELLRAHLGGEVAGREVVVLVGPGNNGGDGRVMARYLTDWGAHVTLYAWKERRLEVDARYIPVGDDLAAVREAIARADVVADALLGTGHARPLDQSMRKLLGLVDEEKQTRPSLVVLAVDLPSGLNADTGAVDEGTAVADLTVTLAFPKQGLFLFPGAECVGELLVGDIGLPAEMRIETALEQLDPSLLGPLLPARPLNSNKGTFGKVMVLAGSPQFIGAAYLVAGGAARSGAGLVTLATTAERAAVYAVRLPEATYHLLPSESASPRERAEILLDGLQGYRALVVGPGLGQAETTRAFLEGVFAGVRALPEDERPQLVVDADGLNNLAHREQWWEDLPPLTVITPHPGEMTRLSGELVSGGGADRLEAVRKAARDWGLVVALKGACTAIGDPSGTVRLNWPPNPALASAGTGDVLAGVIGGLLAQGMAPFDAASAGVFLHSQAGLRVRARLGDAGLVASDLLPEVPAALAELRGH
jgi:hydroxyethylthiazole kinase-like uncharacterized protein yjeF